MTALFLYVKHHCRWLWNAIEWMNGWIFHVLYGNVDSVAREELKCVEATEYSFILVSRSDISCLSRFLREQADERLEYFRPHDFDEDTLGRLLRNKAFLMMMVQNKADSSVVGYFFLRCFFVGKAFHGFLVDKDWEGRGIGSTMMNINMNICRKKRLRLFSTVSQENKASMRASEKVCHVKSRRPLNNGYMLVEWGAQTT